MEPINIDGTDANADWLKAVRRNIDVRKIMVTTETAEEIRRLGSGFLTESWWNDLWDACVNVLERD